ncbi:N-acetyltransferase family protein [Halomonas sp. GXIMD04776]|uniref:GNAT family N-acetyltransferase n=1 Tax=Halomonas sp. GXIMD04776 TaxID=3415605 RepID=UPI003C9DEA57
MQIRLATSDDLDTLLPLLEDYRHFYRQSPDSEQARDFLRVRFERRDSVILLAVDEQNRLLGFTQLFPTPNTVRFGERWILNDLFVVQKARRQGVGRTLLEAARSHCEANGVGEMRLATQVENHAAKALYESLGWQKITAFEHYSLVLSQFR